MGKIVELLIEDLINMTEDATLGVDILSLVDKPAIQIGWQAFSEQEMAEYQLSILELCHQENFGTLVDPSAMKPFDMNKDTFADVADILQGVEVLDKLQDLLPEDNGKIMYRYTGPLSANSRGFCMAMIGLNKIYTPEELEQIGDAAHRFSSGMYPQQSSLAGNQVIGGIGQWKGGVNCKHFWQKLQVFSNGAIIDLGRADGDMGQPMSSMSNGGRRSFSTSWKFADEDKMIITGPAMVPDSLIARKDDLGNVFHVFFSSDTIEKIAQKFMAEHKQNNTDINHDENIVQENTLLESWIVEDPLKDKSSALGYDLPKGTWMVSMKINNTDTWSKIKAGDLNGYSVAGNFLEKIIK